MTTPADRSPSAEPLPRFVRFARREDAENVLRIMQYYTRESTHGNGYASLGVKVTEHIFLSCRRSTGDAAPTETELQEAVEENGLRAGIYFEIAAKYVGRPEALAMCERRLAEIHALRPAAGKETA